MSGGVRRLAAVAAALVVVVTVSSCVSLPDSSSVNAGRGGGVRQQPQGLVDKPSGPQQGDTKVDVVNGYLANMMSFPRSVANVKRFMTTTGAASWNPSQTLIVYQDNSSLVAPGPGGTVNVSVTPMGSLDSRGSWTSAQGAEKFRFNLRLVKVRGQWRITNPPAGMFVTANDFQYDYHQYNLYYFNPSFRSLVPDPVYQLGGSPSSVASALVRNLLRGPTGAMQGVVESVVPPAPNVSASVSVSDSGLADVRLGGSHLAALPSRLELLAAQLSWTLRQENLAINHFRILVENRPVTLSGAGDVFSTEPDAFPGYNPAGFPVLQTIYALSDGALVSVNPIGTPAGRYQVANVYKPRHTVGVSAAVSVDELHAAVVVHGGRGVDVVSIGPANGSQTSTSSSTPLMGMTSLVKPSWDGQGLLWLVDDTKQGAVVQVVQATPDSPPKQVRAPGITGQQVRAFAVSRDSSRFAAILGERGQSRLVVGMVRRSGVHPMDVSLTGVRTVHNAAVHLTDLTSLAWYSPTVIVVLAQVAGSEPRPYLVAIDGSQIVPVNGNLPVDAVSVAAGGTPSVAPVIAICRGQSHGQSQSQSQNESPSQSQSQAQGESQSESQTTCTGKQRLYVRGPDRQWPQIVVHPPTPLYAPTYPG